MGQTRQVQQDVSSDTPSNDGGGLNALGSPLLSMAGQLGNAAMLGMMPGLGPLALAGGLAGAAGAVAGAATPTKEYVDMSQKEKTDTLVGLMDDSRDMLKANNVSEHMESMLAGIMGNEGSRNLRRKSLGDAFVGEAKGLKTKLKGVDLAALQADPDKLQKFSSGLTEEQRTLFDQVKSGGLDLAALDSKDPAVRDAAREQITEAGINLRASQYDEMQKLMAKQKDAPLSKPEQTRLDALKNLGGSKQIGMGGKMGDLAGMSKDRFAEIYAEGQTRFEPAQYKALKASYEKNLAARKDPTKDVKFSSGIGSFTADKGMQDSLATNFDLIADMSTSYGTAQIMGAYAQQGLLSAKGADGNSHKFSLDELKASGDRLTPTSEDVQMQLAFMNMKNVDLTSTNMSSGTIAQRYNGSKPGTDLYNQYTTGLDSRSASYIAAKNAKNAKKPKV